MTLNALNKDIMEICGIIWHPALVSRFRFINKQREELISLREAAFNVACLVAT